MAKKPTPGAVHLIHAGRHFTVEASSNRRLLGQSFDLEVGQRPSGERVKRMATALLKLRGIKGAEEWSVSYGR